LADKSSRLAKKTADLIICARKTKGLTQADVTASLGIVQSTLSRIESNKLIPSVFLWLELAELLDIPADSLKYGVLDKLSEIEITSSKNENGFVLPSKYSKLKCFKVRFILPLIRYIEEQLSEEDYLALLKYFKINKLFFVKLDNQLNLNFLDEFLIYLKNEHKFTNEMLKESMRGINLIEAHGFLTTEFKKANDSVTLISTYISNILKYQNFYIFKVERSDANTINLIVKNNPVLGKAFKAASSELIEYITKQVEYTLEFLPQAMSQCLKKQFGPVRIEKSPYVGNFKETLYKISLLN
jgi:transcriptional regulator with XRE-family HTH domain